VLTSSACRSCASSGWLAARRPLRPLRRSANMACQLTLNAAYSSTSQPTVKQNTCEHTIWRWDGQVHLRVCASHELSGALHNIIGLNYHVTHMQ